MAGRRKNEVQVELFNPEVKERFLDMFPPVSRPTYRRVFVVSSTYEKEYNKDLFDFSEDDVEQILHDLDPLTEHASEHNGRIISRYISWAIDDEKITNHNHNPLESYKSHDFNKFVIKRDIYFSRDAIIKILGGCLNPQDSLCIAASFEGIGGLSGSELRYMKIDDVDFKNRKITVRNAKEKSGANGKQVEKFVKYENGQEERTIEAPFFLEDRLFDLIERAYVQELYVRRNGFIKDDSYGSVTKLVKNRYVLRSGATNTDNENSATDKTLFFRRIALISETLEEPFLTAKNIWRSGMIYMGKLLRDQFGKLEKEQYEMICEKFAHNKSRWYALKEYVNDENIDQLYSEHAATRELMFV